MADSEPKPDDIIYRSPKELLEGLNPPQAQAVQYDGPALLIGAGAGSGKTRVLTRRIAWALSQWRAWPSQILAITFTNKAAREMKERLTTLVGSCANTMWVMTFHAACVRMLRMNGESVGLKAGFTIYDTADSQRLMRDVEQSVGIDPKAVKPRDAIAWMSDKKNSLLDWESQIALLSPGYQPGKPSNNLRHLKTGDEQLYACLYAEYETRLRNANAVDFDDLLTLTVRMLKTDPEASARFRHKFHYIFVDEYQDTNHAQYELLRELSGVDKDDQPPAWVTVVGDSDQSIYAFRGADISNILDFEKDFPGAKTIMLEQNYRSTQTILDAANAVISKNPNRTPKKLWTDKGAGAPIIGFAADNGAHEAQWVVKEIERLHNQENTPLNSIAIMYRTNAQSRPFEEALMAERIPYLLVGGTRFYERREVKDVIAYLQVLANPADNVNLARIINTPKRGIGENAQIILIDWAQSHGTTLWQAIEHRHEIRGIAPRTLNALTAFHDLMTSLQEEATQNDTQPSAIIKAIYDKTGIIEALRKENDEKQENRVDNLSQLLSVCTEYENREDNPTLSGFLESVALVADSDQIPDNEEGGTVTLMTLHTSKGLEYPVVFLVGLEEGTFPHARAADDEKEMAEERRLAYVGITRAQQRLYLTRAGSRMKWGNMETRLPESQFLTDIPDSLIDWKRRQTSDERLSGDGADPWDDDTNETDSWGSGYDGTTRYQSSRGSYGGYGGSYGGGYSGRYNTNTTGHTPNSHSTYGSAGSPKRGSAARSTRSGSSSRGYTSRRGTAARPASPSSTFGSRGAARPAPASGPGPHVTADQIKPGDLVSHDSFGVGKVLSVENNGANSTAIIDFGSEGTKHLLLSVAKMEKL